MDIINILLIAIIILQGLTVFLILGIKKRERGSGNHHKRHHAQGGEKGERKDAAAERHGGSNTNRKPHEHRNNNRPQQQGDKPKQQNKPQQNQPAAAAIDPMKMSLRDINQKIKNAEREQENARKKLQDNPILGNKEVTPENQVRQQAQNRRDNGGNREERTNDRPPRREFNRDGRSDDRPPRQDRPDRFERPERPERYDRPERPDRFERPEHPERYDRPERPNRFERPEKPERHDRPERPDRPSERQAPANIPKDAETFSDDGIPDDAQHGRRFTAKRRQLPGEEDASAPPVSMPQADDAPDVQTTVATGSDFGESSPMFGRR